MTKLTATLKKMLDALAHADAGEYLSAREKATLLNKSVVSPRQVPEPEPTPMQIQAAAEASSRRRVAMYMGRELPEEVMAYTIQTCARLDHDLTVLTLQTETAAGNLLTPYLEAIDQEGIEMRLECLSGDEPVRALSRYLSGHPEVAFMAVKDSGYLGRSYLNGTQDKNALPVPVVVVVTDKAAAATGTGEGQRKVS